MLEISSGRSQKDRITFRSTNKTIYFVNKSATAISNEDGTISIDYEEYESSPIKVLVFTLLLFGTFLLLKTFVLMPVIENNGDLIFLYFIPTIAYLILSIYEIISLRYKGGKEFLKNHAAEHMVIAAYKKFKRIPTLEEAKKFSRINRSCGASIYSAFITGQLIGFSVYFLTGFIIPEIVLFIVPLLFSSSTSFNLLGKLAQFFTTSKADDANIKLAISAITALEELNNTENKTATNL